MACPQSPSETRVCLDCGFPLRANGRLVRCDSCRISSSPVPLEIRGCLDCGRSILANRAYAGCELCRQSSPLRQPSSLRPARRPNPLPCWGCGKPFTPRPGVTRCFLCRSRSSTVLQPATDFAQSTASFDPFINTFEPVKSPQATPRKRKNPPNASSSTPIRQKTAATERLLSLAH
jgi:Zn finger protein HypA/HybF involved in hydrogenase expression